eukprot:11137975-Alexandrium_andersonii.AAC.1
MSHAAWCAPWPMANGPWPTAVTCDMWRMRLVSRSTAQVDASGKGGTLLMATHTWATWVMERG